MTYFTTAQIGAALGGGVGYLPVLGDTGRGVVVATNAEPYTEAAVQRLLRLKAGPVVQTPEDPEQFLAWLEA